MLSVSNAEKYIDEFSVEHIRGDRFGKALSRFIAKKGIHQSELCSMTGIMPSTVSKYISDDNIRPDMRIIIAICIALRLSYEQSCYLLSLKHYCLSDTSPEDVMLHMFLSSCLYVSDITVIWCNNKLIEHGYKPLTGLKKVQKKDVN